MARVFIVEFCDKFNKTVKGPFYRAWGKSLIESGLKIMGPGYADNGKKFKTKNFKS